STAVSPTHVFTGPGTFHIVLIVTDARGAVSKPKEDIVNVAPPVTTTTTILSSTTTTTLENRPPIADFRVSTHSGTAPLTVVFTNKATDADADSFTPPSHFPPPSPHTDLT